MGQRDDIKMEIINILNSAKANRFSDLKDELLDLVDRHFVFNTEDFTISYEDFQKVVSDAKGEYSKETFPILVKDRKGTGRALESTENANFCLFVSILNFLNGKEAFKKKPDFKKGR